MPCVILASLIWLAIGHELCAEPVIPSGQPTFNKITTGPVVEDKLTGSGLLWGDYDNDNHLDLLVLNGRGDGIRSPNVLYRNQGNGTFARISGTPFDQDRAFYNGGVWADFNNDGWLDCYVVDLPPLANPIPTHVLYRGGPGGNFTKVLGGPASSDLRWAWDALSGDFDNDGLVDLFAVSAWTTSDGQVYNTHNNLFRNLGDFTFARVAQGPTATDLADSEFAAASDYDGDGDLDLLVSSHFQRLLYRNDGNGAFTRIATGPIAQDTGNSAGAAWGDYDNDGRMDLCLATFFETIHLFHNDGAGQFTRSMLGPTANYQVPSWADYDNDGWLDLFVTHGYLGSEFRNRLYHNNGNGTFTEVRTGPPANEGGYSIAGAWADYDNNGFLDLVVGNGYQSVTNNFLYHNNGNENHWLLVKLVGTVANRLAIGAKVRARASISGRTIWQMREISGGGNHVQHDPRAHFGLGDATSVETLRVEWPSGQVTELHNVSAGQILTITEAPGLRATGLVEGAMQMQITAHPGMTVMVERTNTLVGDNWSGNWDSPWMSVLHTNRTMMVTDPEANQHPQRFYKARVQ